MAMHTSIILNNKNLQCILGVVQFSFSSGNLAISEQGNLTSQLFILRTGSSEDITITFQVRVIPGTALENAGN